MTEHWLELDGRRIWYAVVGDGDAPPLICVPGGPGLPHDYLEPMSALAEHGHRVVFYDPLGSGSSERPADTAWSVQTYERELAALAALFPRVSLFAHSAASLAALPFACSRPPSLAALVLASGPPSIPEYVASVLGLLDLDGDARARFLAQEEKRIAPDAGYVLAYQRFTGQHYCLVHPRPEPLTRAVARINPSAHRSLKGGLLIYTTELRDWSVLDRLAQIAVPTLITCGGHDILGPETCARYRDSIPRCELAVFPESSHMPHFEEPDAFIAAVSRFLDGVR